MTDTNKGTAVVTGASSGIGAIYADRLARQGYDLILVARSRDKLETVAKRIATETGRYVHVIAADLNDRQDLEKIEQVLRTDSAVTVLVNNAGFGAASPFLQTDIDWMGRMIDLNITALTRLAYAAGKSFAERGNGTIINISSIAAIASELLNGVYSASKAYVLTLSQSMSKELSDRGVRVQAVLPGATATEFWDVAGLPHANLPQDWVMRSEDMVDAALAGLALGEVVTIPPLQDGADWAAFDGARQELSGKFRHGIPGSRYIETASAA